MLIKIVIVIMKLVDKLGWPKVSFRRNKASPPNHSLGAVLWETSAQHPLSLPLHWAAAM